MQLVIREVDVMVRNHWLLDEESKVKTKAENSHQQYWFSEAK
jgi:hypothetical protein